MPDRSKQLDNEEFNLNQMKSNEMHINMAKLFLMSEDPTVHFADLQKPNEKTQQRLDKIMDDVVSMAEGFLSDDPEKQKQAEQKYTEYTERCRATVMDMNVQKETMYALGKNPDEMTSKEQKEVLKNPENAEKLGAFLGDLSACIQKADRTNLLSEILTDNKRERVPQIDHIAGETRVLSELYWNLAAEWTKSKAEKSKSEQSKSEPEAQADREKSAERDGDDVESEFEDDESLLDDGEQLRERISGNLHVAKAPKITGVQGLTTWQRIVNWFSQKLGFGKVYSKTSEEMTQTEEQASVQDERSQERTFSDDKEDKVSERSAEAEREAQFGQRANSAQSMRESRDQRQNQDLGERDVEKTSSEKMIRQLQIENLRKDSLIKYLQAELLRAQIREQTLRNEKLMNEMAASQKTKMEEKAKETSSSEKKVEQKKEQKAETKVEQKVEQKTEQKTEKKPAREKISFAELSGEKPEPARRHMKLESIQPEKRKSKDDTMIDYRSFEPSEKSKKSPSLNQGGKVR